MKIIIDDTFCSISEWDSNEHKIKDRLIVFGPGCSSDLQKCANQILTSSQAYRFSSGDHFVFELSKKKEAVLMAIIAENKSK